MASSSTEPPTRVQSEAADRPAWPPVLRPSEVFTCPAGCADYPPTPAPASVPEAGGWGVECRTCGALAWLRPHFGDREEDLLWIVEADDVALARVQAAREAYG